jgi:hypothetical protein
MDGRKDMSRLHTGYVMNLLSALNLSESAPYTVQSAPSFFKCSSRYACLLHRRHRFQSQKTHPTFYPYLKTEKTPLSFRYNHRYYNPAHEVVTSS